MLLLAMLPMPYGYYILLRLIVCGTAIYLTWYTKTINRRGWMWTMGFISCLFNPFIPVFLDRATWGLIDLVLAIIFFRARKQLNAVKG